VHPWRDTTISQLGLLTTALGIISCSSDRPPGWINQLPERDGELCAIGVSGPTYYAEDARTNSLSLAKTELARTLKVKIQSQMLLQSQGDDKTFSTTMDELASFKSDVVLEKAQVRQQWVQPGTEKQYGIKGTVYTLVCMPL